MTPRGRTRQRFVEAAVAAFNQFAQESESRRSLLQVASALETPGAQRSSPGSRLPVCACLDTALAVETRRASLRHLIARFKDIEPLLEWRHRPTLAIRRAGISSTAMPTR